MTRRAIVFFNLGGPDRPDAINPFLYNLFSDRAIIDLPRIFRLPLAKLISNRRKKRAKAIYSQIGGQSPILEFTRNQAAALEASLMKESFTDEYRVFICMRYWHPRSTKAVMQVKIYDPDEVLLLPLYPQFSTTTTGSSFKDWNQVALSKGLQKPTYLICCYPSQKYWAEAQANLLIDELKKVPNKEKVRVLFSAHGLPKKIIDCGDPYQWQVEQSAQAIVAAAKLPNDTWKICYQSRVGPMEWIGPSLENTLKAAAEDGMNVVILPIAFVSEHSETLVELDIEFKKLAKSLGISVYQRVPALGTHQKFIEGLKNLTIAAFEQKVKIGPIGERHECPAKYEQCPCNL